MWRAWACSVECLWKQNKQSNTLILGSLPYTSARGRQVGLGANPEIRLLAGLGDQMDRPALFCPLLWTKECANCRKPQHAQLKAKEFFFTKKKKVRPPPRQHSLSHRLKSKRNEFLAAAPPVGWRRFFSALLGPLFRIVPGEIATSQFAFGTHSPDAVSGCPSTHLEGRAVSNLSSASS